MQVIVTKPAERYTLLLIDMPGVESADEIEKRVWEMCATAMQHGIDVVRPDGVRAGTMVETYVQRTDAVIGGQDVPAGSWLAGVIWEESAWPDVPADGDDLACRNGVCQVDTTKEDHPMPKLKTTKLAVEYAPTKDVVLVLQDGPATRLIAKQFRHLVRAVYPAEVSERIVAKRAITPASEPAPELPAWEQEFDEDMARRVAKGAFADRIASSRMSEALPAAMQAFDSAVWSIVASDELSSEQKRTALKESVKEFTEYVAGLLQPVAKRQEEVDWSDLAPRKEPAHRGDAWLLAD